MWVVPGRAGALGGKVSFFFGVWVSVVRGQFGSGERHR